jgi:hypothetical protein
MIERIELEAFRDVRRCKRCSRELVAKEVNLRKPHNSVCNLCKFPGNKEGAKQYRREVYQIYARARWLNDNKCQQCGVYLIYKNCPLAPKTDRGYELDSIPRRDLASLSDEELLENFNILCTACKIEPTLLEELQCDELPEPYQRPEVVPKYDPARYRRKQLRESGQSTARRIRLSYGPWEVAYKKPSRRVRRMRVGRATPTST